MERESLFRTIFLEVAIDSNSNRSITTKKEIFCISKELFPAIGIFTPLNLSIALKYNVYTIFYADLVPIPLKMEEE